MIVLTLGTMPVVAISVDFVLKIYCPETLFLVLYPPLSLQMAESLNALIPNVRNGLSDPNRFVVSVQL